MQHKNDIHKNANIILSAGLLLLSTPLLAEQERAWNCGDPEFKTVVALNQGKETTHHFLENFELEHGATTNIQINGDGPLETIQSKFQKIEMFDTRPFGKMLVLDGIIQLTQFDNFAYHEMIAHVPLMAHPNPKRVLIVGGGDGGTLKEVLKHKSVTEVVACEIDTEVIRMAKKYFPELASSYDDPRVTLLTQDAVAYVKSKENYFDVICVDSSDPIGPAVKLFEEEFYEDMKTALTEDGIAAAQGESMFYHQDEIVRWNTRNNKTFKHARYYYTLVPTYPSGTIGFLFCSKKHDPFEMLDSKRATELEDLQYYSTDMHKASFVLPAGLKRRLKT